jgi:hypothetical protein
MKVLYLDCFSGISGDMTLGALLNLGIDRAKFKSELDKLNLKEYRLEIHKGQRKGIEGLKVNVILQVHEHEVSEHHTGHHVKDGDHHHPAHHAEGSDSGHHSHGEHEHHHRNLEDIREIVGNSTLSSFVKERAMNIFKLIAEAEGKIHGKAPSEIHFHEVGAVDSIVDVVGACICFELLDVERVICSPLNVGKGFVKCAHGTFPVPAPAALEILKGIPVYSSGINGELVTPTGAAIVKEFASEFADMPSMKVSSVGYGLGTADREVPNVLRAVMGEINTGSQEVWVIETNIDDMNPQFYSPLIDSLFSSGAYDVFLTPIIMKKGRPGIKISVLCGDKDIEKISKVIMQQTTTLGVRRYKTVRDVLEREFIPMDTPYGTVNLKVGRLPDGDVKYSPEYDHLASISREKGIPIKDLYDEILSIARNHLTKK